MRTTDVPRRRRGWTALVPALVALALVAPLAACGDDEAATTAGTGTTGSAPTLEPSPDTGGTTATSGTDTGGTTATSGTDAGGGIDPLLDAGLEPVTGEPRGPGTAYLTEVDVARHEGFDRVVLHFEDARPGYEVGYEEPPLRADGSGAEVPVDGVAVLQVRMTPASIVDLSGATFREVYTGPDRITPDTPTVAEVVRVGDFEGYATWAIGVRDRVPFRVLTLDDPARIVVDVANH